jgi:hypothetical protein
MVAAYTKQVFRPLLPPSCLDYYWILTMQVTGFFETSVSLGTARRYNPEKRTPLVKNFILL